MIEAERRRRERWNEHLDRLGARLALMLGAAWAVLCFGGIAWMLLRR